MEKRNSFPSAPTVIVGVIIVQQINLRFFILLTSFWRRSKIDNFRS